MAWLDRGLKQRIVGALVLVALAVVFLPMLLTREDERREVRVEAPPMPEAPSSMPPELELVEVPEPESDPIESVALSEPVAPSGPPVVQPPVSVPPVAAAVAPAQPSAAQTQPPASAPARLDASGLPVSWSIQLASLSSRANAEALVQKLRAQGYNGYMRQVEGMNRVYVGPLIERSEAERLREQLKRQQKLDGFIVRFTPERQ